MSLCDNMAKVFFKKWFWVPEKLFKNCTTDAEECHGF